MLVFVRTNQQQLLDFHFICVQVCVAVVVLYAKRLMDIVVSCVSFVPCLQHLLAPLSFYCCNFVLL